MRHDVAGAECFEQPAQGGRRVADVDYFIFHQANKFMLERLHSDHEDLMSKIGGGDWDDSTEEQLGNAIKEAIDDFGPDLDEEGEPLEEGESDRVREAGEQAGDDSEENEAA